VIATSRGFAVQGLIRPFHDRLDIVVPYIWYPVPLTAPEGPVTVFTDRWYDDREHWVPPGVGVVPFSQKPYFGPVPDGTVLPLQGTPDQWVNGFSYADYLAGKYPVGTRCLTIRQKITVVRIREAQAVLIPAPRVPIVLQAQDVPTSLGTADLIRQAQNVRVAPAAQANVNQAQDVPTVPVTLAQVNQAQDVPLVAIAPALVAQAQTVDATTSLQQFVEQAQDTPYVLPVDALVEQAQDVDNATFIPPGATCATAAAIALNTTYAGTTTGTNTDWFFIPSWMTGTFELIAGGGPAASPAFTVQWGLCVLFVKTENNAIPCDDITSASGGFGGIYVSVIGDGTGFSYTFRING
jgi:hypothetical protein